MARTLINNKPITELMTANPDTPVRKLKGVFIRIIQHFRDNPEHFDGYNQKQRDFLLNMDDYKIILLLIKKWKQLVEFNVEQPTY